VADQKEGVVMALGIDIYARYQRVTDWNAVRNRGVGYTWVKLTDGGGRVSNPGDSLVAGAKSVGIPVGGYHYAQLSPTPERQAEIFVGEVRRLGADGLVPMLDLESPFAANGAARDFGIRFCRRVASLGFKPGVYMNNAFAKALRPDGWGIGNLVIWLARYGARPDAAAGRYDVHQYSSSGQIPGIQASAVDLNESYTNNHFGSNAEDFLMALSPDEQHAVVDGVNDMRTDLSIPYRESGKSGGRVLRDLVPLSEPLQSLVDPATSIPAADMLRWIDKNANDAARAIGKLTEVVEKLAADVAELKAAK
jgi:GH25 family lysozyme M1 (1,4-beta-N-acetylmuramidase)